MPDTFLLRYDVCAFTEVGTSAKDYNGYQAKWSNPTAHLNPGEDKVVTTFSHSDTKLQLAHVHLDLNPFLRFRN